MGIHTLLLCTEIRLLTAYQGPDLQCYVSRIASHPERLQYIYFNTVLLLRAVARLGPYLSAYDYCASGTHEDDAITYDRLKKILEIAGVAGKFDETALFKGENANVRQHADGFHEVRLDVLCAGLERGV
jgi:ERO1-like protein beta